MRRPPVLDGLLTLSVSDSGFWFGAGPCPRGLLIRTSVGHGSMVSGRACWARPLHWVCFVLWGPSWRWVWGPSLAPPSAGALKVCSTLFDLHCFVSRSDMAGAGRSELTQKREGSCSFFFLLLLSGDDSQRIPVKPIFKISNGQRPQESRFW